MEDFSALSPNDAEPTLDTSFDFGLERVRDGIECYIAMNKAK